MEAAVAKEVLDEVEIHYSQTVCPRSSRVSGDGVSVAGGRMRDVVGVQQTTVYNVFSKTKDQRASKILDIKSQKKRCWNTLIRRQRKEESWFYPFPWDPRIRLAPEEYFVEVDIETMDRTGQFDKGKVDSLHDLFCPQVHGADRPEHILIRGDAGYGKSTMCIKIAFDWANNIQTFEEFPPDESLVILFKLRNLPPLSDFENELCSFVHSSYTGEGTSMTETRKTCWSYGNKLLLILDGYDELYHEHQKQIREFLSSQSKREQSFFKYASVILTSRPETDNDLLYLFDKHCRITGLSEERRTFFVNNYFKRQPGTAEPVLCALNNYESTYTKNMSPLLILMMCYIVKQQNLKTILSGNQLTFQCIHLMAKRWNDRQEEKISNSNIEANLCKLGKFFYRCLSNYILFVRAEDLKDFLGVRYEFAIQFGILRNPLSSSKEQCDIFEPIHKHFMDVLAKHYLLKEWSSCSPRQPLTFVNEFVDSLTTEVLIVKGIEPEPKIKIMAKDVKYRANKISYVWEIESESNDIALVFQEIPSRITDIGLKITTNNVLQGDSEYFINYITNAFSGATQLNKWTCFLACFKQYLYRLQFCRIIDRYGNPTTTTTDYISPQLCQIETQRFFGTPFNYTPWTQLMRKVHQIEVELGEALSQAPTCLFICKYILGFNLECISNVKQPKKFFSKLYKSLECLHDRFYIKCVLKTPVGFFLQKNKIDLITFQCNYKHEHLLPREMEVGGQKFSVPAFQWDNIQSLVFYFVT